MRQNRVVRVLAIGVAAFAIVGLATTAGATTINLDLNTYCTDSNSLPFNGSSPTGTTAAAPDPGAKQWNNLLIGCGSLGTQTYSLGLIDSNGNASGAASFSIFTQNQSFHSQFTSGYNSMLWDYAYSNPGTDEVISFSALNPAHVYDVYVYSWWDWGTSGSSTTSVLAAAGILPAAQTNTWGSDDATNKNTFTQGVNYIVFSGLTPTAAGLIELGGNGSIYNGFQLVESSASLRQADTVPEPSTLLLLTSGIPVIIRRLRRKI